MFRLAFLWHGKKLIRSPGHVVIAGLLVFVAVWLAQSSHFMLFGFPFFLLLAMLSGLMVWGRSSHSDLDARYLLSRPLSRGEFSTARNLVMALFALLLAAVAQFFALSHSMNMPVWILGADNIALFDRAGFQRVAGGTVNVSEPFVPFAMPAFSLVTAVATTLAVLLGVAVRSVRPSWSMRSRYRIRIVQAAPLLLVGLALLTSVRTKVTASILFAYLHPLVALIPIALIAAYFALSWYTWRRADVT